MPKKVLFLDDNVLRLQVEIEALQDGDWQILEAEKMHQAIEYLKTTTVDVLILDIIMPFDEQVHLEDQDWDDMPVEPSYTGVAFYRYLQRNDLLNKTSVVIYTYQSLAGLRKFFPEENAPLFLDKFDLWPDKLVEELNSLMKEKEQPPAS